MQEEAPIITAHDQVRELLKNTGSVLPISSFTSKNFNTWKWKGKVGEKELVPDDLLELWKAFGKWERMEIPFLYLYGVSGVGKTHVALAFGWQRISGGHSVQYWQVEGLLDALREKFDGEMSEFHQLINSTKNCHLLILDDLGSQKITPWALAKLDSIVNSRYDNAKETIITSNFILTEDTRDIIPERIYDRCREGTIVRVPGKSHRKESRRVAEE